MKDRYEVKLFFCHAWHMGRNTPGHLHNYLVTFPCTWRFVCTITFAAWAERCRNTIGILLASHLEGGASRTSRHTRLLYRCSQHMNRVTSLACTWRERRILEALDRAILRGDISNISLDGNPDESKPDVAYAALRDAARTATDIRVTWGTRHKAPHALPEYLF